MGFRLVWYATVSIALAGGVVVSAFHERANFYSACVYLAQSNLCLMILINLVLLIYGTFIYSLQRICYGALRPIEVEQLYEKGWFAVTETCLAMTIFREEVGAWFLVMFVALLTGKIWGWIGDGRVEILGQQPPANPRLVHIRLSTSLAMSMIYDLMLMKYIINAVIQQARPNMMVMFLFEFAILTTTSTSTACRYGISLIEASVVKKQTQERLEERQREVREQRAEIIRRNEASMNSSPGSQSQNINAQLPEDDIDETEIEVPGWEAKGHWILTLDLVTDFVKLGIYTSFFVVLLMFYGIPIHIVRDLLLTARSCMKRLAAFLRYRRATRDMNEKYPDATAEDIQREDTCIICREEMRPWASLNPQPPAVELGGAAPPPRPSASINERIRPKKLPCGHILHLGCLKSWLERQQVCPTCRRPVVDPQVQPTGAPNATLRQDQPQAPGNQNAVDQQPAIGRIPARGMRMLNFGPLRVGFGQANLRDLARELGGAQAAPENVGANAPRVYGLELAFLRRAQAQRQVPGTSDTPTTASIEEQLQALETQILGEFNALRLTHRQWQLTNLLWAELNRIRAERNGTVDPVVGNIQAPQAPQAPQASQPGQPQQRMFPSSMPRYQSYQPASSTVIPSGHPDLPPGVTIPEGWSLLPLQSSESVTGTTPSSVPPTESSSDVGPTTEINTDIDQRTTSIPENTTRSSSMVQSYEPTGSGTFPDSVSTASNKIPGASTPDSAAKTRQHRKSSLPTTKKEPSFPPIRKSSLQPATHTENIDSKSDIIPDTGSCSNSKGTTAGIADIEDLYNVDKGKARAATVEEIPDDAE
ncbi:hypothetical protein K3495_g6256 [Podosphaera aphanis]|nr:hypothetical protein K3495_g6256 [Podosphaera aphanis]